MTQSVLVWRAKDKTVYFKDDVKANLSKKMTVGGNYRKIGDEAFKNNIKVREVDLKDSVDEIGVSSFSGCTALKRVGLGKVRYIRKDAFMGCTNLTQISFPAQLQSVGAQAFALCKRLETAEGAMNNIGDRAFYKCKSLKQVTLADDLKCIGREAFCDAGIEKVVLPESLEVIKDSAFLKCRELEYVRVPESVRVIEKWAFHGCNRLKVLEISGNPEFIGEWIINKGTKIRCQRGSTADIYCEKYGFDVEYM